MKIKHVINLHKGATTFVVLALMAIYQNFAIAPWVYLALHATYGMIWLVKDQIFPDKQWEQEMPIGAGIGIFLFLGLYWVAPFLLISRGVVLPVWLMSMAISLNILGVFLHYSSDAQKYFTLKYQPGLITEGFFARCRNTNYLGEALIYCSFALMSQHWLPFVIFGGIIAAVFLPNMRKKDQSLSRYPEFEVYQQRSGLLLPKLFTASTEDLPSVSAKEQ